jgi:arginase
MKTVQLIGVPLDLGAGRRGVDMGPSALRIAGVATALGELGLGVTDAGNIVVAQREELSTGAASHRYLAPIVECCRRLHGVALKALRAGHVPVVLGGDHSLAVGSIAAAADHADELGERLGVVWLDAHGDMNDGSTSPSGNVHGMPLAALLGRGAPTLVGVGRISPSLKPDQVALFGVRHIDAPEARVIRASGVHTTTMRDVDERGMRGALDAALGSLADCDRIHVSFDVDFLDAQLAPGVGTPVRGGPDYREAHLVMETLADTGRVTSVDVVELNPILDERNRSAEVAVELLQSLFGKRIL